MYLFVFFIVYILYMNVSITSFGSLVGFKIINIKTQM